MMLGRWEIRLNMAILSLVWVGCLVISCLLDAWEEDRKLHAILYGGLSILPCLGCILCVDILRRAPANSHTLVSLAKQYIIIFWRKRPMARKLKLDMLRASKECQVHQRKALMDILKHQAGTEYGRKYRMSTITSREEFIRRVPLSKFADYAPYMERIARGEHNILTKDKVTYLALTAGSSGKNKMYPMTLADRGFMSKVMGSRSLLHEQVYDVVGLKRVFEFRIFHPAKCSPAGIPMGGCGYYISSPGGYGIIPNTTKDIHKAPAMFYIQALFSMVEREIGIIEGYSSDLMLAFFKYLETNYMALCDDIEDGIIKSHPDIPEEVRLKLAPLIKPNPKRAQQLRTILKTPKDSLARRLWPDLRACQVCKSGGFAHSGQILAQSYLKGVVMFYPVLVGTEGCVGVVLENNPQSDLYTLIPNGPYFFEFIPVEHIHDIDPPCLFMEQLEMGSSYEVVITNPRGLFRNRPGDVIKVVSYHGNTPKCEFQYRCGHILNIVYDRTPVAHVHEALVQVTSGQRWIDIRVADYAACESFHVEKAAGVNFGKGKYMIFLELNDHVDLTETHMMEFDDKLCQLHETYAEFREQGAVAPAQLIQVKPGTFQVVRDMLMGERHHEQFKMSRVLRDHQCLVHMWDNRVNGYNRSRDY